MRQAPANKAKPPHRVKDQRPSARQRGYDAAWEKAARAFLAHPANRLCECGAPAVLVRHRISIAKRPDLRMSPANWLPGCQRCNRMDRERERRGYSDEIGSDGLPTDPSHPFNK